MCKFWECCNAYCSNHVDSGIRLGVEEINWDPLGQHGCRRCGSLVRERDAFRHHITDYVYWISESALIGWIILDTCGALIGAAVALVAVAMNVVQEP